MAQQGAFDFHDLIRTIDLHLELGGTWPITICCRFILFESHDLSRSSKELLWLRLIAPSGLCGPMYGSRAFNEIQIR